MTKLLKDDRLRNWKPRICEICSKPLPNGARRRSCGRGTSCYSEFQSFRQGERWRIRRTPPPANLMKYPDPKLCQLVKHYTDLWPGTGDCWQSNLGISGSGQGGRTRISYKGKKITMQRASWMGFKGPIGDDEVILNNCDNPMCSNPDHIYKGRLTDKRRATDERGRGSGGYVTKDQAEEVRALYFLTDISQQELADKLGVKHVTISSIVNFKGRWANREPTTEEANALNNKRRRLSGRARRKYTDEQVREIRAKLNSGQSAPAMAREFNTLPQTIRLIKWKRGTYADVD